jgi:hypothetical protein
VDSARRARWALSHPANHRSQSTLLQKAAQSPPRSSILACLFFVLPALLPHARHDRAMAPPAYCAHVVVRRQRRRHNHGSKCTGRVGGRGPVATRSVTLGRSRLARLGGFSSLNSASRRKQTEKPSTPKPITTATPTLTVAPRSRNHPEAVLPFSAP